nr:hypothetical protein MN210_04310 [Psychrobacter sp. PraFG1]
MSAQLLEQAFLRQGRAVTIELFEKSAGVGRLATRYKKPPSGEIGCGSSTLGRSFLPQNQRHFSSICSLGLIVRPLSLGRLRWLR